jgi:hypothetical protein
MESFHDIARCIGDPMRCLLGPNLGRPALQHDRKRLSERATI